MISQKSIQEVLETAKVEDVVGDFVNLKRRGVNMIGLCPFHNEKTPSFTVSPSKNIYKCFGCGQGGNSVQFLMEHESLTFPESIRWLAKKYGLQLEETESSREAIEERQHLDSLYLINQYARDFFLDQMLNTDTGKSVGLSYFKERGFLEDTIKKFGLGFAPNKRDAFTLKAVQEGYNAELLQKLGLTKNDRDFFRNRVMFPIHNLSGKVIGFGGRILVKDVKAPKYINSPETEIYNKSKVLYGAFFAKRAIRQHDECILVEGYTDVISLHQAGIENVVASSGTSLTVDQIRLIKRYTPNVKILYDGDLAGIKAALRGLDLVLEQDLNVKVVLLPEGEDPDSYLQKVGTSAFKEFLNEQAKDFIMFKAQLLLKEAANDPIKKTQLIKDIVQSIARIPDPVKRAVYVRECAGLVKVEEQILVNETNKLVGRHFKKRQQEKEIGERKATSAGGEVPFPNVPPPEYMPDQAPSVEQEVGGDEFQEKGIVRVLINFGHKIFDAKENTTVAEFIIGNIEDVLDNFDNQLYQRVVRDCYHLLLEKKEISSNYFLNHQDHEIQKLAVDMMSSPYEYSENWAKKWDIHLQTQTPPEENYKRDSIEVVRRLKFRKLDCIIKEITAKMKEEKDEEKSINYSKVLIKLLESKKTLAAELNNVVP